MTIAKIHGNKLHLSMDEWIKKIYTYANSGDTHISCLIHINIRGYYTAIKKEDILLSVTSMTT